MTVQAEVAPFSREYFAELLGPELVADVLAKVATAPAPSPEKVAEVVRLFAVVPVAAQARRK